MHYRLGTHFIETDQHVPIFAQEVKDGHLFEVEVVLALQSEDLVVVHQYHLLNFVVYDQSIGKS